MSQSAPPVAGAPLKPFDYPLWTKVFCCVIAIASIVPVFTLPPFLELGRSLTTARKLYEKKDFAGAEDAYQKVLKQVPGSAEAKIGAAEALFAQGDDAFVQKGFSLIEGLRLSKDERSRLSSALPEKYRKSFSAGKETD